MDKNREAGPLASSRQKLFSLKLSISTLLIVVVIVYKGKRFQQLKLEMNLKFLKNLILRIWRRKLLKIGQIGL